MSRPRPLVEILYFDGCPNHELAHALVTKVAHELSLDPELRLIRVADQSDAERLRFLGSPTIRVDGVDVDPHTPDRDDFALCCRVFTTAGGVAGLPEERWVRDALLAAGSGFEDFLDGSSAPSPAGLGDRRPGGEPALDDVVE